MSFYGTSKIMMDWFLTSCYEFAEGVIFRAEYIHDILREPKLVTFIAVHFICFQETGAIYTHHQKSVVLDADAGNGKRKIIAFVGGLDLCDGRYDTPKHSLFRTLRTTHKEDYHNPTFPVMISRYSCRTYFVL